MKMIRLGATGRSTTQLGFGCSSIMGVLNRRQSLALLENALDAGIRHFDTAPMYGYGEAESCVGEFLSRHRGEVTVTTKFGIPPPQSGGMMRIVRGLASPLVQRFPALKKRLQQRPTAAAANKPAAKLVANPIFTAEQARTTLEKSLIALRTERIDLWLLHDVKPIDLADSRSDSLLRLLEDAVRGGKVGMFGVGTDREVVPELIAKHPQYCDVVQHEWSVRDRADVSDLRLHIHHRALSRNFHALAAELRADPERCSRWSREVGADLFDSVMLARLMLKAACVVNPAGIVLFSSKQPEHIRENVAVVKDQALEAQARRLYEVVQRDRLQIASL